ncbi:RNA polymerase subunit sigma-24 [Gemmobacter tilapiae]|uniref:RNA polymerase subunit sigma-24 n=1 Tax=Neogemmobacter tilapiae TaxID=875041 RepID=A0A918WEL5_9RHOB|nr:RNA polymerase subunit sigma-24 [Gemmobacter tilapiae]
MTPERCLEQLVREDRGRLMAALVSRLRDMQRAEDALQEAMASALVHWGRNGLPASPKAWLLQVAWRKALDRIRRGGTEQRGLADLLIRADEVQDAGEDIPDHRLRLIFTCCHPALEAKSRVALTLRTVCGLTTGQIAQVFLDAEPTMGQRLSRAKAKIAGAGIAYQVPGPEAWGERLHSVLTVVYLIFTAGYTAGPVDGRNLCEEAIFLVRLVNGLRPDEAEIEGALALLLITHSRRAARVDELGITVPLARQNRRRWDLRMLSEGRGWLDKAIARRASGPFQIKAAIASLASVESGPTDWPQIAGLYQGLLRWEPTPVVRLNLAVAMAEAGDLDRALDLLHLIGPDMQDYQPFHAAVADLLARSGQGQAAREAYDRAIAMATHSGDARFLIERRAALPD